MNQNGVYNSIVNQLLGLPSGSPTIAGCRLASTSDLKQCYSMRMGTHSHLYNITNFFCHMIITSIVVLTTYSFSHPHCIAWHNSLTKLYIPSAINTDITIRDATGNPGNPFPEVPGRFSPTRSPGNIICLPFPAPVPAFPEVLEKQLS